MTQRISTYQLSRTHRRGEANIELIFFMPMLVALLSMVFLVSSLTISRMHATLGARNKAFSGRHEPWKQSDQYDTSSLSLPLATAVGLILPVQNAQGVLLHAEEVRDVNVRFGPLKHLVKDVSMEHYVLGGSWDHQEIPFDRHARLTLTSNSLRFGVAEPMSAMGGLFGSGSGGGDYASVISKAIATTSDAQSAIGEELTSVKNKLRDVQKTLQNELGKKLPDFNKVRRLKDTISKLNKKIGDLTLATDKLRENPITISEYNSDNSD